MKKLLVMIAAVMFVFLAIVPAACADNASGQKMYIAASNGKTVRIRENPSDTAKVLINLGVGRPVTVISHVDATWSEITYQVNGRTKHGYVMSKFLSVSDPAARKQTFKDVKGDIYVKVLCATSHNDVYLWSVPSKHIANRVRSIDRNESLVIVSESNAWYLVSAADGELGYVAKAYVKK